MSFEIEICERCGESERSDWIVLLDGQRICHRCVAPGLQPDRLHEFNNLAVDIIRKYLAECEINPTQEFLPKGGIAEDETKVLQDPQILSAMARHLSHQAPKVETKPEDKVYKTIAEAEQAAYLESMKEGK